MKLQSILRHALLRLFIVLFVVSLAGALGSCKSSRGTIPTNTTIKDSTTTTITKRDTIVVTAKDSSYYKAWLACVNGKVTWRNPATSSKATDKPGTTKPKKSETKPGRHLAVPNVTLGDDGLLEVDCQAEAEKLRVEWEEKAIKHYKETHKQELLRVEKDFTIWQAIQIWAGRIFLFIVVATILVFIFKPKVPLLK